MLNSNAALRCNNEFTVLENALKTQLFLFYRLNLYIYIYQMALNVRFVSLFCVSIAKQKRKERVCRWLIWNRSSRSALLRSSIKGSSCCAFKYTLRSLRFHAIMLICGAFLAPFHYRFLIVSPIFHFCAPRQAFLRLGPLVLQLQAAESGSSTCLLHPHRY